MHAHTNMKNCRAIRPLLLVLMLSACSPDHQTNKIAETPRAVLDQAKQTSALVDEQAAEQQKEIDAATGQ